MGIVAVTAIDERDGGRRWRSQIRTTGVVLPSGVEEQDRDGSLSSSSPAQRTLRMMRAAVRATSRPALNYPPSVYSDNSSEITYPLVNSAPRLVRLNLLHPQQLS